jgi:hypothetical protein
LNAGQHFARHPFQRSQNSARWRSLSSRVMLDQVTAPV